MSIFRDSFKKEIREQLKKRQDAMTNRTPQNLQYLNSRNSWIRMVSSVDVNGSADQAKAYVLQGGTLNSHTNANNEITYTPKSGIGDTGKEAYSTKTPIGTKHRLGIRPMPGITSIDVKSKSAYGSLREVTVNFQCWDIHQLEELEVLYMRPGYTVLIEWGWTPYLDNTGKYQPTFTDFYSDTILKAGKTERSKIFQDLYDKSIKYGGNYDAMFGYVKNYSWSARPDGGYDCQTIIISTGEIIESLKVNYVRPDLSDFKLYQKGAKGNGFLDSLFATQGNTPSILFKQAYEKNTLAGVWTELYYKWKDPSITTLTTVGTSIIFEKAKLLNYPGTKGIDSEIDPGSDIRVYITLETVFDILNKFLLPKEIIQLSTKTNGYSGTPTPLTCVAHPLQISVDPATCVIKSPLWSGTILTEVSGAAAPVAQAATVDANAVVKGLVAASVGKGIIIDDFKKYMNQITPLIFDQVNNAFINGTEGDDWKFSDGLAGLIKEQFIEKSDQVPPSTGEANNELSSLYYLYQIQQSIKSNGINLDVGLVDNETAANKKKNPVNLSQLPAPTDATFKNVFFEKSNISTPKTIASQGGSFTTYEFAYYDYASSTVTITSTNTQESQTANTIISNAGDALKVATDLDKLQQNYFLDNDPKKEIGIIGNIYISLDFLYKQALNSGLESQDSKEKNEINLYNYIKSIASTINTALGSVNNFEVHVDPVDNIARIIDVNYCEPDKKKIDLFELQVHNLNSVVRSYSLQSKIFPNQSAIIAIGSQAQGGELGQQNNTMIDWNTGIVDRILPKKTFPVNENALSSNKDDLKMANSLSSIVLLLADLNKEPSSGQSTIMDDISKAKNALRDLIIYFQSIVASPGANRNLIPTKFSFEMDGIGGLVIGHLFKINDDILPRGYKYTKDSTSVLAQTVTSIGHTIGNGDWSTTIDALNIILDDIAGEFYTLDIKDIVKNAVEIAIDESISPAPGAGGGGGGGTGGEDCGGLSEDTIKLLYPRTTLFNGLATPIVKLENTPTVNVKLDKQPIVPYSKTLVSPQSYIEAAEKTINQLAPNASIENKRKILISAFAISKNEQGSGAGFKGFNNNISGIESSGFNVFAASDTTGKVKLTEGGTGKDKFYYAFSDLSAGLVPLISNIIKRNMFSLSGELKEAAWRWYRDWNGFGARTKTNFTSDCDVINEVLPNYAYATSQVDKYSTFKTPPPPPPPPLDYKSIADGLFDAMERINTDEDKIYELLGTLKTQDDWNKVQAAYGIRTNTIGINFTGDLKATFKDQLTGTLIGTGELERVKNILATNRIIY